MYYTTIPLVSERPNNRRWDASKLRELRKRLDSGTMSMEETDQVAGDFLDGEIVDLASDWLGNTVGIHQYQTVPCVFSQHNTQVVQKLFEKCSAVPRFAMLERITPHLAMIGIHKNGTWAAQKIIECVQSSEEIALIVQNLRAYAPPLLLDQFGNYVVQYVACRHCALLMPDRSSDAVCASVRLRTTSFLMLWSIACGKLRKAVLEQGV